tara:strand:- start:453 stop:1229 length:777 start_codon:yes stop_codon:yes gene_type:complete
MHNIDIKVSVVIPSYNSYYFIDRAIKSVLIQSYPINEIIIVDDFSSDDTVAFAKDLLSKTSISSNILINSNNSGAAYSRQRGCNEAKGTHIAFLDSDDEWHVEHLESLVMLFKRSSSISFAFSRYNVYSNSKKTYVSKAHKSLSFLQALNRTVVATPCVMIDKEKMPAVWDQRRTGQDYWLWLKLLSEFGQALCTGEATVNVYQRTESLSSNKLQNIADVWQVQKTFGISIFKRLINIFFYLSRSIKKVIEMKYRRLY